MILRSKISDYLLAAGVDLIVSSNNADEPYFKQEFCHPRIFLELMPSKSSRLEKRFSNWRQYLLMNPKLGRTLNYKRETLRHEQPLRYYTARGLNLILGRIPFLRKMYMAFENVLFPAHDFDAVLKKYNPSLVVTGTPGFNLHDVHALRAARRLGIPTATAMLSWDNLTSKGYMNGIPDYLLVWSQLMANEAVAYHDFPRNRIFETGAAQFDSYYQANMVHDSQSWRLQNNVPANAFLMMYGTINPGICGHELEILKIIISKMRSLRLDRPCFLWVRLHPQVVNGAWENSLEPFKLLESNDVHVEVPPVIDSKLHWDLPKEDLTHLKNLIASSDVLITTSSTLSIDAACVDTPIINVFFDGVVKDSTQSVARFKKYTHYANILSTGGVFEADTPDQFVQGLIRYATTPGADRQGRAAIVSQQLGKLDGQSGKRSASVLLQLALRHECKLGRR